MDSRGNVYNPEAVEALKAEAEAGNERARKVVKQLVGLDEEDMRHVANMNRAQRRAWYSDHRRALKKATKKDNAP